MKQLLIWSLLIFALALLRLDVHAQNSSARIKNARTQKKVNRFDPVLAKKLGADDLGMKQYVMVFLKRGPAKLEKSERSALINKHLENIGKLAEAKKLVIAGPFLDNTDLAGIYVFDVKTVEEAKALTETDPAVTAGVFIMELHPWYGSAALTALDPIHKKIAKKKPGE